jgi:outer membrane protein TolC
MNNLFQTFSEARLRYDTERREQVELARQALELKIAQRDFIKAAGDIKSALEKLAADKPAPMPPKAATAAPEVKVAPPAPKAKPAAPKASPKRPPSPQSIAIGNLEQRLAVIAGKVAALGSHLSK